MLRRCLGMAYIRHTRIEDGSEPLQRLTEFIGPGFRNSALFAVEYDAHMLDWVEFIYEEYGQELVVLAIDAWQLGTSFGSRVGGDARARARSRSR